MIDISCDHCGKRYRVDETRLAGEGAKYRCTACKGVFVISVPGREEAAPSFPSEQASGESSVETVGINEDAGDTAESSDKKPWLGLGGKVVIVMLFVSLVPLGIFWAILYNESSSQVRKDTEMLMAQIGEGLSDQVEEWIDKNVRVLKAAARLPDIVSMDQYMQEPVLRSISAEYPWKYLVFTTDEAGMNVGRDDGNPLTDYSDRQYYADVMAGKTIAWQTLIGRTSGQPALVLAVPITSDDGTTVGVMASAMTIDEISQSVARWQRGDTGFAFLVDETGKVVSHQLGEYVVEERNLEDHPLVRAYRENQEPVAISFTNENGKPALGHAIGNQYGWVLAIQQEHDEVFAPLRAVQRFAILLLAATVFFVVIIALISARSITKPIISLTSAAEKMSLGDLKVTIPVTSKDEIGHLAQALRRMQMSLRLALERLGKKK